MVSTPMHRRLTALVTSVALAIAVVGVLADPAIAGDGGGDGRTDDVGLESTEVRFTVRSSDSDTACVSYYETTKKRGPAKHFDRVSNHLEQLPYTMTVGASRRSKHWAIAAWATDDCASTADPDGTVRCSISIDGKRKARSSATDAIAFCFS
jgi:hypothetical protein